MATREVMRKGHLLAPYLGGEGDVGEDGGGDVVALFEARRLAAARQHLGALRLGALHSEERNS